MAKDHGNQIKNDEQYEKLRDKGMSKEKAARIANDSQSGVKGGKAKKNMKIARKTIFTKKQRRWELKVVVRCLKMN